LRKARALFRQRFGNERSNELADQSDCRNFAALKLLRGDGFDVCLLRDGFKVAAMINQSWTFRC